MGRKRWECVWIGCVLLLCMVVLCTPQRVWAAFEIDSATVETNDFPLDGTLFKWNWDVQGDVQIDWNATDDNSVLGYIYLWSTSDKQLPDSEFNSTNKDGEVTLPPITTGKTLFKNRSYDDENSIAYLHIKTKYVDLNSANGTLSNDVVIGPINMDNVAPSGSVQVVDGQGISITSTGETTLQLALSASVNPQYYYIQEDATPRPAQGVDRYTYNSTVNYILSDATPGSKTLYVWFEDAAGNISETPETVDFELLGNAYISPNEATIDISKSATKDFYVEGGSGGYDWSVINEIPETENATVAQITTNATNATTITLEGLNPGTCQLQANGTNGVLTSGVITIEQSLYVNLDIDGNKEVDPFTDGLLIIKYMLDFPTYQGDKWIDGAVAAKAARTSSQAIKSYLDQLILKK